MTRTTWLRNAWNVIAGRPGPSGAVVAVAQTVFVFVTITAALVGGDAAGQAVYQCVERRFHPSCYAAATNWFLSELPDSAVLAFVVAVLSGVLAFGAFLILRPRGTRGTAQFFRCWWRAWALVGLAIVLTIVVLRSLEAVWVCRGAWALRTLAGRAAISAPLLAVGTILLPAYLARREGRPRRLPRWRPVCPECGYNIRGLTGAVCPECGTPLPTTTRTYRRWAWRRLRWERRQRGNFLLAYLGTLLRVTLCPAGAARGLLLPDRYGRAIRWAAARLAVYGLAVAVLQSDGYYPFMLPVMIGLPEESWSAGWSGVPATYYWLWLAETVTAGALLLGALPLTGIVLAAVLPGVHPAARRGMAKWSLYLAGPLLGVALLQQAWAVHVTSWRLPIYFRGLSLPTGVALPGLLLPAVLYALWWARGVSANPYVRERGCIGVIGRALLVGGAFCLLGQAFDPELLRWLI